MEIKEKLVGMALENINEIDDKRPPAKCPDEDILNAFIEGVLYGEDRSRLDEHLAFCHRCRKITAGLMKITGEDQKIGKVIRFPTKSRQLLAVAAALFIVVGTHFILEKTDNLPWGKAEYVAVITDEEASIPRGKEFIFEKSDGPEIVVLSPKESEPSRVPVKLDIVFKPGPYGLPPDLSTLKIKYKSIDITDRFTNYIKDNEIKIKRAFFPPGEHSLLFMIEDESGNTTTRSVVFMVK